MDWAGWAVFGLVATTGLTAVMIAAQLAGGKMHDVAWRRVAVTATTSCATCSRD